MLVKTEHNCGGRIRLDETGEIFRDFLALSESKRENYVLRNGDDFKSALDYWRQFHSTQQDSLYGKELMFNLRTYLKNRKTLERYDV